ncbi:MAG TPA: hypothetical protein VIG69_09985, partial [Candidatus Methylomirabilis sp.]
GLSLWLNELRNAGVTLLGYNLANLPTQLEPAKYERMVFGVILILMMIFRPQGVLPRRRGRGPAGWPPPLGAAGGAPPAGQEAPPPPPPAGPADA